MKLLVCVMHSDYHKVGDWATVSDAEADAYLSMRTAGQPFYELLKDLGSDAAVKVEAKEIELKEEPAVMESAPEETAESAPAEPEPEPVRVEGRRRRSAN